VVDCGALSDSLIESEMFGHVRGAFTGADRDRPGKFAAAGRGTLVLDEINSLRSCLQSKLLRAVEERLFEPVGSNAPQPLRARLIALTNTSLDQEVLAGRFRADLYFRLNVVCFHLAPLRERRGAIPALAAGFLAEYSRAAGRRIAVAPDAEAALCAYDWPGNVRELRNAIEGAVALRAGPTIQLGDLPRGVVSGRPPPRPAATALAAGRDLLDGVKGPRETTEIHRIMVALERNKHNRQRAAAELGMSRVSLYKKLHKYGLFERT
jgi:transcriptional regulator with PAS, ATPase and Fis domain